MSIKLIVNPNESVFKLNSVRNQLVCDVLEYKIRLTNGIRYVGWSGSTTDKYFSVIFTEGVVSLSLEERTMLLGREPLNLLVSEELRKAAETPDKLEKIKEWNYYRDIYADSEVDKITFEDIMKPLSWIFESDKVEIQYCLVDGNFNNPKINKESKQIISLSI